MKELKVLSLFNGMNCIGLALQKLGIPFSIYACEIDKYANKVSSALFPETINLGCVKTVEIEKLPVFDLVVAGSPCQGFSFAGKQLNFEDERSKLFFDFVKILEKCKGKNPNVKFLLENVKMKKEYEAVISRFMKIDPIQINSALLSAQNRQRLYWTNIGTKKENLFGIEEPGIKQPKDKGILLKDILEEEVDEKYFLSLKAKKYIANEMRIQKKYTSINGKKSLCLTAKGQTNNTGTFINCAAMRGRYKLDGKSTQEIEIRKDEKTNCLTSVQKDNILIIPEATKQGYTDAKYDFCHFKNARIRRLTPRECARLQTIPEDAIEIMLNCGVSNSQLYKMLGNGWTVDVIAYILSHEKTFNI